MSTSERDHITDARVKRVIEDAKGSPKGIYLWDTKLRGFGLRASPINKRGQQKVSWIVQRWSTEHNRMDRVAFAEYPDLGVQAARREAENRKKSTGLLTEPKKQLVADAKNTLGPAVEKYLIDAPLLKAKSARYWHETGQLLERALVAQLGKNKPLARIGLQDVRGLIKDKLAAKQKGAARNMLAAVRPFFKWCVAEGLIPVSPLASYIDAPGAVDPRERTLTADEIKKLWAATEAPSIWNCFYRLLLLTAQRRGEVAGIRRSELDLEAGTWSIPGSRTKNGEDHIIHLSSWALAEIARCPTDGEYLFPASRVVASDIPTKNPTISGYSKAKAALDKRMPGVAEWNVHDLRRTAATWMDGAGFETNIIEWVLNHISGTRGGLIGTYQRHPHLPERKLAIETWNNYVAELVGIYTPADNVISFVRA